MNTNVKTDAYVQNPGGGSTPPCVRLTSNAFSNVTPAILDDRNNVGASTNCVRHLGWRTARPDVSIEHGVSISKQWYVLRVAYGNVSKCIDYLHENNVETFCPMITKRMLVNGKEKFVETCRIPNIFFAYSTFDVLKVHVYDNVHISTKYLRFYYSTHHDGTKEPLVVPNQQMNSLMIICGMEDGHHDVMLRPEIVNIFKEGQRVLITEGDFAGVEGIVARYKGQQRVGVVINGLMTAATAYVPNAFLRKIKTQQ